MHMRKHVRLVLLHMYIVYAMPRSVYAIMVVVQTQQNNLEPNQNFRFDFQFDSQSSRFFLLFSFLASRRVHPPSLKLLRIRTFLTAHFCPPTSPLTTNTCNTCLLTRTKKSNWYFTLVVQKKILNEREEK